VATAEISSELPNPLSANELFISSYEDNIIWNGGYSADGGLTTRTGVTGDRLYIHNNTHGIAGYSTSGAYALAGTRGYSIFKLSNPTAIFTKTTLAQTIHGHLGTLLTCSKDGKNVTTVMGFGRASNERYTGELTSTSVPSSFDITLPGSCLNYSYIMTASGRLIGCSDNNGATNTGMTLNASTVNLSYTNGGSMSANTNVFRHIYCSGDGNYIISFGTRQVCISRNNGSTYYKIRTSGTFDSADTSDISNCFNQATEDSFLTSYANVNNVSYMLYASLSYDGKYISLYNRRDISYSYSSSDYGNSFTKIFTASPTTEKVVNIAEGTVFSLKTTKIGTIFKTIKTVHPTTVITYFVKVINSKFWLSNVFGSNGSDAPSVDLSTYNQTYIFDQSDPSNLGHLLVLGFTRDVNSSVISYQRVAGTPGQNGAFTSFRNRGDTLVYFSYNDTGF
jgi:hypothetical protein